MTLNLIALTDEGIHIAADFRLTEQDRSYHDDSDKIVVVNSLSWNGVVTYTGVGRVAGTSVASTVASWLTSTEDLDMPSVAERIRDEATRWFNARSELSGKRHTFLLAGFDQSRPRAMVISNFERWEGAEDRTAAAEFETTSVSASGNAKLIVTGMKPALSRADRRRLQRDIARVQAEPARVRQILHEANRKASFASAARDAISPDCSVYSLDISGDGRSDRPEHVPGGPAVVVEGINMLDMLADATAKLGVKGAADRLIAFGRSPRRGRVTSPLLIALRRSGSGVHGARA